MPETRSLARAIEVIAAFVADFEPARYSPEDAASLVGWFCRTERLAGAGKTLAAARVAESNRPSQRGHRSPADWLATITGQPIGQAIDELKLGAALPDRPELDAAFRAGRVSRPGATLVAGAAEVNPAREKDLVHGAERDSFRQLKERCLAARAEGRSAADEARRAEGLRRARRCRTWTDPEGAFRLDAALTPDAGAVVAAHLAAETNRHFERARKQGVEEPRDAYGADALVALVTGRGYLGPTGTAGRAPDPKARVTVRVDLAALRRGSLAPGEVCELPGVGPVSLETAREVLGDGLLDLVITDGVDVTTVCRLGRSVPAALQTALAERDRTCVVPGCDQALGLERDHWQVPVEAEGPTSMENLCRLCTWHHYLRHHQGFTLSGGPGHWTFTPPDSPKPSGRQRVKAGRSRTARMGHSEQAVVAPVSAGGPSRARPQCPRTEHPRTSSHPSRAGPATEIREPSTTGAPSIGAGPNRCGTESVRDRIGATQERRRTPRRRALETVQERQSMPDGR